MNSELSLLLEAFQSPLLEINPATQTVGFWPNRYWIYDFYQNSFLKGKEFLIQLWKCLPHTFSSSSLPSPQSLSLSHFHRSAMHRPFRQVKSPPLHLVPLSTIQCLLLLAKYQCPSGHWHSAPFGPMFDYNRWQWKYYNDILKISIFTCNLPQNSLSLLGMLMECCSKNNKQVQRYQLVWHA